MAYHFDGVDDKVDFAVAPLSGYTVGPVTLAAFFRVTSSSTSVRSLTAGIVDSADSILRAHMRSHTSSQPRFTVGGTSVTDSSGFAVTQNVWTLIVVTSAGAGSTPRLHHNTAGAWTHVNFPAVAPANVAVAAGDRVQVGKATTFLLDGDVVCAGIKKAAMSDAEVEALSRTDWAAWLTAGFDWLVGFETSGAVQDQGAATTGDETGRVGTTLVADPAGWVWTTADTTAPSVPAGLTATPDYSTAVDLAWTASTDAVGVTGYRVERKTGAGAFAEIATPAGTSYHDTGLEPATAYVYRVRATDLAANLSGYSSEVTATTLWYPDPATADWVPIYTPGA